MKKERAEHEREGSARERAKESMLRQRELSTREKLSMRES